VAGDLAAIANSGAFLNLDERADFDVIANLAPIKIRKGVNLYSLPQLNVRSDAPVKWLAHGVG